MPIAYGPHLDGGACRRSRGFDDMTTGDPTTDPDPEWALDGTLYGTGAVLVLVCLALGWDPMLGVLVAFLTLIAVAAYLLCVVIWGDDRRKPEGGPPSEDL
jgi:hypothetical protein